MCERHTGENGVALKLGEAAFHQVGGHLLALAGFNVREHPVERSDVRGQHDEHRASRRVLLRDDEIWFHAPSSCRWKMAAFSGSESFAQKASMCFSVTMIVAVPLAGTSSLGGGGSV